MMIDKLPRTAKVAFDNGHTLIGSVRLTPRNKIKHKFRYFAYEDILDSVYEMVRDTAEGNGELYEHVMPGVLKAEGWVVRAVDQRAIIRMLREAV